MQEVPFAIRRQSRFASPPDSTAVHNVTRDWMSHRCQVHADLVRASCVQCCSQKVEAVEARESNEGRLRRLATLDDCHALPVSRIPRNGFVDGQRLHSQMTAREDGVSPSHAPLSDRFREDSMSPVVLRDEQQPRRLLVQPVHESRPRGRCVGGRSDVRGLASAEQRVNEGAGPVSRCRMHDHAWWLINNEQVVILKDDAEWDALGLNRAFGFGLRKPHLYLLTLSRFVARLFSVRVDKNSTRGDERRGLCARAADCSCDKQIEANITVRLDKIP
jgi:hypothetical protein